jgi:acyl-CoA thioester hydrolase
VSAAPSAPKPFVHEHRLRVRYAETDQMGRAHHANHIVYMEEGRTRMMADLGLPYGEVEKRGFGLVVRAVDIRYRGAALYEDELVVRTHVRSVRGASVDIAYDIRRATDGAEVATGSTQLACVDLRATPPAVKPLPPDVAAVFEAARDGRVGAPGS